MPKVSVVIPTYNREDLLPETIESVLAQTYKDFEIIVIDDGSTDNTREVISKFPIRYFYQENQGVSAALNNGAVLAQGEYVAFLGSDDIWLKDILEREVEVLDKNPDVGFVYSQMYLMDGDGTAFRVKESTFMNSSGIVDREEQLKELLFYCRMIPSATTMRRNCFNEVGGFHTDLSFSEDYHLFVRLVKRFQVAFIAEPLVKHRLHRNQLHRNVPPKIAEKALLLILQEIYGEPGLALKFQPLKKRAYCHAYQKIAGYAYGQDMEMTRRYLKKALSIYPEISLQKDGLYIVYKYLTSFLPGKLIQNLRIIKNRIMDYSKKYRE